MLCHFSSLEFASKQPVIFTVLLVKEIKPVTRTKAETNWVYKQSTFLAKVTLARFMPHRIAWNKRTDGI